MKEKKGQNIMIVPKCEGRDDDCKVMVKAKLWMRSRDIEPIDITITVPATGNTKPAVSANLSFWNRILFALNFWGELQCEPIKVFG